MPRKYRRELFNTTISDSLIVNSKPTGESLSYGIDELIKYFNRKKMRPKQALFTVVANILKFVKCHQLKDCVVHIGALILHVKKIYKITSMGDAGMDTKRFFFKHHPQYVFDNTKKKGPVLTFTRGTISVQCTMQWSIQKESLLSMIKECEDSLGELEEQLSTKN